LLHFQTPKKSMNRKHPSKKQMQSLCGEIHADDCIDPTELFRPARKQDKNHRKAQQLCHQVADTLSLVLSGELGDELADLRVVSVTPAPDSSQLLVVVAPAVAGGVVDPAAAIARLQTVAGRLRSEVAAAITRRRAPKLLFQFLAGPSAEEVNP
jgi:ribosome-binding factor A